MRPGPDCLSRRRCPNPYRDNRANRLCRYLWGLSGLCRLRNCPECRRCRNPCRSNLVFRLCRCREACFCRCPVRFCRVFRRRLCRCFDLDFVYLYFLGRPGFCFLFYRLYFFRLCFYPDFGLYSADLCSVDFADFVAVDFFSAIVA